MIGSHNNSDYILRRKFELLTEVDKDYWSFKNNSRRQYGHGMFPYPAMMVPQVVRSILQVTCEVHPNIQCVGDPFSGSGTIMTEGMMRGFSFSGSDINPLAVLLCKVKSGPFFIDALKNKIEELFGRIKEDCLLGVELEFRNRDKWFDQYVQVALSKIRRAIRKEDALWARRFFWVALAEIVRNTSNSRTSTYKLHVRNNLDNRSRSIDPIELFKKVLERNIQHYEEQALRLSESGQLVHGRYQQKIKISLGDVRSMLGNEDEDIIITSPPYGDNATTVPYGQYSYLPLQWVDILDIDEKIDKDYLISTQEIDTRSLGGSKKISKLEMEYLMDCSPEFKYCINGLVGQPADRSKRVAAFIRDLNDSLMPILSNLKKGGLMVWTLGNRKVGGKSVPLDLILSELLRSHNTTLLFTLNRSISSKKMALKNNISETMSSETILIMRKAV